MISRATIVHLRVPFSFFLLPVFLFAWATVGTTGPDRTFLIFVILHFLLYPASNGFNSYYDKDEKSIGGLQKPPPVSEQLLWASLTLDLIALILAVWIHWQFAIMILLYGLVSKAYSHPEIRLKKMPFIGWLTVGFFQGFFIFLASVVGLTDRALVQLITPEILIPAILTSFMLLGSYPMTQIYQHDEDRSRGDITLSLKLGVKGTFHFTGLWFFFSTAAFVGYFFSYYPNSYALLFLTAMLPVVSFFLRWYFRVRSDQTLANFTNTMRLNLLSAFCLNSFFFILRILNSM